MSKDLVGALILGISTLLMLYKHRENLDRIKSGTEAHFSLLWNKEKEIERIQKKFEEEENKKQK